MIKKLFKRFINFFGYELKPVRKIKSSLNDQKEEINSVPYPFTSLQFGSIALEKLLTDYDFETVLDIGSGGGHHSKIFLEHKKTVTAIDFGTSIYAKDRKEDQNIKKIVGNYYDYEFEEKFDAIWACHVLEHQPNPNLFLQKIKHDLKEHGILVVTVPPLKHQIVGGHLSLWNAGLLMYHLVIAGFNCKNASILQYGYNISLIVRKDSINTFPTLDYDNGDINRLLTYFPSGIIEPFNGDIKRLNWQ